MNGKTLKVVEYNLTFGNNTRLVNVFGCFKYKPNNNLYLIYADVETKYNIIYYGSSHIKNNSILSMNCKEEEQEIIKEYIFKIISKEPLDNFENISLETIEGIEIISSNKLEVKNEIITSLVDMTLPKKEVTKEEPIPQIKTSNKKFTSKLLIIFLIVAVIFSGIYLLFTSFMFKETVTKNISCSKTYQHSVLDATITEDILFTFGHQELLENIKTVSLYKFNNKITYQNFINKGTIYKYMPDDSDIEGKFSQDDINNSFTIITEEKVKTGYKKPTAYEDVLSYYKNNNYTCNENIEKE